MVTVEKGSYVFDTETNRRITSKKGFRVEPKAFKLGWCYYEIKGILYRTLKTNLKKAAIACFLLGTFLLSPAQACSRDISELTPEAQAKFQQLKEACNAEGLDFKVTCTYRSQQDQDRLYEIGRSRPGNKVTWTRTSVHTSRKAFDIAVLKKGTITWEPADYLRVGQIGRDLGLTWGGDWKVRDYVHFELKGNGK